MMGGPKPNHRHKKTSDPIHLHRCMRPAKTNGPAPGVLNAMPGAVFVAKILKDFGETKCIRNDKIIWRKPVKMNELNILWIHTQIWWMDDPFFKFWAQKGFMNHNCLRIFSHQQQPVARTHLNTTKKKLRTSQAPKQKIAEVNIADSYRGYVKPLKRKFPP